MSQDRTTTRRPADPATLVTAGATTLAWYAVPDVVGPRWGRVLAKAVVGVAGAVLTLRTTGEGREAWEALRSARDAGRAAADTSDGATTDAPDPADSTGDEAPSKVPPAVLVLAGVGSVAVSTGLAVAGEKWVYRRGERLRARGLRLPHTRVALAMAAVAVALTAVEPYLRPADEDETAD